MAISTCIKCNGTNFEMVEKEPLGSNFKILFIQCTLCGGVVGTMEYFSIGAKLVKLEKGLNQISKTAAVIDHNLRLIIDSLNRRI